MNTPNEPAFEWTDESAEQYARKYGDFATNRIPVEKIQFPTDATIVDIGCGTGASLRRAAEFATEGVLIGIDPVPRMLEIAREQTEAHPAGLRMEYRLGSADDLPIDNDFADFVFAFDSFDFWGDKERALDEVHRILRPGGRFVVVKDSDMPDAAESRLAFLKMLDVTDFTLLSEQYIEEEDVSFTIWISARSS